ncbi:MAG: biliverdin-producing heme oxygenase, partial [Bacteroidales bacterium]|nr:biliverdin-producing heme oxygenase [Bacteroidales bacterium]
MEKHENLHQSLKTQTLELHEKAHSIPYIKHLLNNDIPRESYVGHLRTFAIIYGTLERQLAVTKNAEIKGFLEGYLPKLPLLLADLESFHSINSKDIIPAVGKALHVADKILLYSEKNPFKLIGFLYTLDGSLNGGSVFKTHLTKTFNLENHQGISYFRAFNEDYKTFWKNFTGKLNNNIAS